MDGLVDGIGKASFLDRIFQVITPMIAMPITTKAGTKSFFNPNVIVISFEVNGFLSGISGDNAAEKFTGNGFSTGQDI